MESLADRFLASLRRGEPDRETLARAGENDPAAADAAFRRALAEPELGGCAERWGPALLRAARPGSGAGALADLARARRDAGLAPLDLARTPLLPAVVGASAFLTRTLLREPAWTDELDGALPAAPADAVEACEWGEIRRAKYCGLLRISARDLAGRPFREGLRELSDLADGCLRAALACATRDTGAPVPALLALGKLGGRELNFSSDVDLLFVSDPPGSEAAPEHNARVSRLIRHLKKRLEEPTPDGFGYRVDLDLRPEGRAGVLVNSVEAALSYYESFGAEWERQMLIRLRPVAGPRQAAQSFVRGVTPFVFRRAIDPGVMRAVREMKQRVESERRHAGRDLEASLKEGPGGIRDVEFLVQAFQLFHGGRHPELHTGNVCDALDALAGLGLMAEGTADALRAAYTWLRRAEHAVQLVEEQQTSAFPREPGAQTGLARRMGYDADAGDRARSQMLDDWITVRTEVRQHFEALVLGEATS